MAGPWERFKPQPVEQPSGPWAKFQGFEQVTGSATTVPGKVLGVPADIANDPLLQFDGFRMTPDGFVAAPPPEHFNIPPAPVDRAALGDLIGIPMENPEPGNLGDLLLRGFADLPDLATSALELPVNIADAIVRAVGGNPEQSMATAGMRMGLEALQDASGYLPREMDAAGIGQGTVDGGQLVDALDPRTDIPLGDRLGDVGTFALEQGVRSAPQMAAALASVPAYVAGRANQVAETRAANDERELVTLPDIGIAVPAAAVEALLERFTTARLLPGGTTAATPGAMAALGRILRELGLQGGLGGVEELAPYLAETAGTETGTDLGQAVETFAAGAVTEGAMGAASQGTKEAAAIAPDVLARANAALRTTPGATQAAPAAPAVGVNPSPAPSVPLGETDVIRNAEQDAELDALLLRNLLPDPAAATPTNAGQVPERASLPGRDFVAELAALMRQQSQTEAARTAGQPAQSPAAPVGSRPAGGDLSSVDAEAVPVAPTDDTPDPPADIRYGKRGRREALAARQAPEQFTDEAVPTTYEQQQRDPLAASEALGQRAEALAPRIDALTNDEARIAAEAIGGMKSQDRRDPREYLRNQHPDDIEEGLAALAPQHATVEFTQADYDRVRAKPAAERTDAEIAAANAFTRQRDSAVRAESEARTQALKDKANDTDGFADALPPMQRKRVVAALNAPIRRGGVITSRKEAVRAMVAEGYTVGEVDGAPVLRSPDGSWLEQGTITKTGVDYARHLLASAERAAVPDAPLGAGPAPEQGRVDEPLESVAPIETPEFRRWFGDSKVVDADGRPLVMYHGTGKRFSRVSMKKGAQGLFWMTSNRGAIEAGEVGASARGVVMDLYAKIEKPAGWAEYDKYGIGELKRDGYDGLVLPDSDGTITVAVFDPGQVKSADRNRGTFDPNNPSILANTEAGESESPTNTALESLQQGEADADLMGLREAVNKVLGERGNDVIYLHGTAGLPDRLKAGVERRLEQRQGRGRTAALYDPQEQQVFIFTHVVTTPEGAVWNAMHEFAGHHGLRTLLGDKLDGALDIALQNPTVSRLANAIGTERNSRDRLRNAEEALAELAAAVRTGDYDRIARAHGVDVPQGIRASVTRAVENFLRRLKALLDRVTGQTFSDEDVRSLLEAAWRYARGEGATEGGSLESVSDPTDTPEFRRWFGDSKVVDADGKPLVVYHGTPGSLYGGPIRKFTAGSRGGLGGSIGHWFASTREAANVFARERYAGVQPEVIDAYLRIENPKEYDGHSAFVEAANARRGDTIEARLKSLRRSLVAAGHDGIVIRNSDTDGGGLRDDWVAFDGKQIKSATGNRGTFDPDSPSILESVEYTPAQEAALAKAGLPVDRRSSLQRITDKVRGEIDKVREAARDSDALKQATFDRFHGLRLAEADLALSPEQSPYIAARMTAGLSSNMEGLMLFGAPQWDGGILAIKDGTVGLLDALKPVEGKLDQWLGWMVGRRAQVLKAQGRENNLSDADIAALLSLADGNEAAFKQAAGDYLKIKNAVLDVAEQAGLIDPAARAAWDHAEYIPFYRADNSGFVGPGTRKGLAGQTSGIRTLKGGQDALADPLANIVRNFSKLIDASLKNRATLLAVDEFGAKLFQPAARQMQPALIPLDQVKKHLQEQGVPEATIASMPTQAVKGVQRMLSIVPPTGEDVVRVMRAGKPEYYTVLDPLVLRSLTAFKAPHKNIAIKPFIWFKRLLTVGVTTTAEFVGANFIRDSASAWVISDDRFIPGWDSLRGVGNTLRGDQGTRDMMMAGSTFLGGNFYDGNPDEAAAALRRALRKKGMKDRDIEGFIGTVARSPLQLWDGWLRLSGAVENANRRAVYDAALKAGRSRTEAAYMARDLMDFAMQGDAKWVQFFADVLPFFNARLQGLYKLGRRAGTPQGRRAMLLRGGVIVMASSALYAWNMLAHQEAYDELEEWDKDAYWHIAPGTEYHVRIPKPFEIGLVFGTAPERAMEAIRHANTGEGDDPNDTWAALVRSITGTLAFNPIPQAALPLAEQWANKSFFTGRPIEGMGDDKLLPEDRSEWFTSDTAKLLGKMTGLSPKRIEHLWKGYTAGLGGYVLDASDYLTRKLSDTPDRPDMTMRDWPVLGRFLRGGSEPRSKYVGEFYDAFREAEQIEQSVKERWVTGDKAGAEKLAKEHAAILGERVESKRAKGGFMYARVKELRKVRDGLTGIREDIESVVLDENLSAEQKRARIEELERQRNKLVRSVAPR